jgi:cell division protein FtsZ
VTAGDDLAIGEVDEIVRIVRETAGVEELNVYWGLVFNPELEDEIRVTVVATGFDNKQPPQQQTSFGIPGAGPSAYGPAPTRPARPDVDDIDVPTFLRRGS